jgi:hypothetical protein
VVSNLDPMLCQHSVAVAMDGANVHPPHPSHSLFSKNSADMLRYPLLEFLGGLCL